MTVLGMSRHAIKVSVNAFLLYLYKAQTEFNPLFISMSSKTSLTEFHDILSINMQPCKTHAVSQPAFLDVTWSTQ